MRKLNRLIGSDASCDHASRLAACSCGLLPVMRWILFCKGLRQPGYF